MVPRCDRQTARPFGRGRVGLGGRVRLDLLPVLGAVALVLSLAAAVGCGAGGNSNGARPWTVCGQVVWSSASGPVVQDVTATKVVTVSALSSGFDVFLRLTGDCAHGADVTISPSGSATYDGQARARDGRLTAVALHPKRGVSSIDVAIKRQSGFNTLVRIRLMP